MLNPSGQASYFRMQHAKTGQLLDSSDDGRAYLQPANNGYNQIWKWDGQYFTDLQTGKVLDSDSSGNVYTNGNNGGNNQKWTQVIDSGNSKIQNVATGRFLDGDDQAHMLTSPSDKLKFPIWNFNNGLFS